MGKKAANFEDRYVDSCRAVRDLKAQTNGRAVVAGLNCIGLNLDEGKIKDIPQSVARKLAVQELYHVAIAGTYKETKNLLLYGIDNDTIFYYNYEDRYVVDIAIICGNIGAVRALAESGCNLLHTSREGHNPLRLAFDHGCNDIAAMLIRDFHLNPFEKNKFGDSLFNDVINCHRITSLKSGNLVKSAELLLRTILTHPKSPTYVNSVICDGRTPVLVALANSSAHMASVLMDHGACVTVRPDHAGDTCLSLVFLLPENKRLIRRILQTIARDHERYFKDDPDDCVTQLQTYLHTGLPSQSNLTVPEFLLRNHLVLEKIPEVLDIYEEYFTHPDFINNRYDLSRTLLMTAVEQYNYPMFVRILRSGADPSLLDRDGLSVVFTTSCKYYYVRDRRFFKALLEVGEVRRGDLRKLFERPNLKRFKLHNEAAFAMDENCRAVKPLKCLIRNSLRANPKARKSVLLQAKHIFVPKDWLDFLHFQDLLDGQDFMLEHNKKKWFPDSLELRDRYNYGFQRRA